jgi:uncharacterized protein (TIGR02996 family)
MHIDLFPPTDELCGFLHRIKEAPDDDAPRLVLADFLEENGHPDRGEFIRLQCEVARLAAAGRDAWHVERRERDLLTTRAEKWLSPWQKWLRFEHRRFVRGLVDLTLPVADLCRIEAVVPGHERSAAWVQRLSATELADPAEVAALLRTTLVRQVVALRVAAFGATEPAAAQIVAELAASPALDQLRDLALSMREVGRNVVVCLAESRSLINLTYLSLDYGPLDDSAAEALAEPRNLPNLKSLRVNGWRLSPTAVELLRSRFGSGVSL